MRLASFKQAAAAASPDVSPVELHQEGPADSTLSCVHVALRVRGCRSEVDSRWSRWGWGHSYWVPPWDGQLPSAGKVTPLVGDGGVSTDDSSG